jgi:hypothetical protein
MVSEKARQQPRVKHSARRPAVAVPAFECCEEGAQVYSNSSVAYLFVREMSIYFQNLTLSAGTRLDANSRSGIAKIIYSCFDSLAAI